MYCEKLHIVHHCMLYFMSFVGKLQNMLSVSHTLNFGCACLMSSSMQARCIRDLALPYNIPSDSQAVIRIHPEQNLFGIFDVIFIKVNPSS
jgi:hypothetical protein